MNTSVLDLIGNTPLMHPQRLSRHLGLKGNLLLKLEGFNPGGSAKDRAVSYMLRDALDSGKLKPGGTVVESTSGNTGIALALIGRALGLRVILTMPETMSQERRDRLEAGGAELILTPGDQGMAGAGEKAREILASTPGAITLGQFDNPHNPRAHREGTAQELIAQTAGQIHAFVAGVGTGGTITGTAQGLRAHNPAVQIIAVEPAASPVLSGGKPGPHPLQGLGAGFVPRVLDLSLVDQILPVTGDQAVAAARALRDSEGLLLGYSGGAALHAALALAGQDAWGGKTIVALMPDFGDRYLSTPLWSRQSRNAG